MAQGRNASHARRGNRSCVLVGDGRDLADEDKINEANIRPIAKDHELYTTTINVKLDDASSSVQEFVDAIVLNRQYLQGNWTSDMYYTTRPYCQVHALEGHLGSSYLQ